MPLSFLFSHRTGQFTVLAHSVTEALQIAKGLRPGARLIGIAHALR